MGSAYSVKAAPVTVRVRPTFLRQVRVVLVWAGLALLLGSFLGTWTAVTLVSVATAPITWRFLAIGARTDGDRLLVRNVWSSWTTRRADIAGFTIEDRIAGREWRRRTVDVVLHGGRVRPIRATYGYYFKLFAFTPKPNANTRADDFSRELNAWLHAA
jgi:hypothetical protein